VRIKKLKPTDREYILRDDKKVLVNEKKGIVIGKGVDSLMKFIDNQKQKYDNNF
jgi:prefoldin subunit 5